MTVFKSRINVNSESFAVNRADMLAGVEQLHILKHRARDLSEKRRAWFEERGHGRGGVGRFGNARHDHGSGRISRRE